MPKRIVLLTIIALLLAAGAGAAESVRVVRGPWWWYDTDRVPCIGIAVSGSPAVPDSATLDDTEVPLTGELHALASRTDDADHVLMLRTAPGLHGRLRLHVAGQPLSVLLRRPPSDDAPVRIALASARAWPDRAGIDALAKALGGPPQVVLALGDGVPIRLGTGGWEDDIPIAIVAPANPDLAACTAGLDEHWRNGLRYGVLGLPASADRGRADLAMARDLSPWLVYLDVPAGWDPAIGRQHDSTPRDLGVLLAACQRLSVPLILGSGAAGLVSEPLHLDPGGGVSIVPDGVRYALPVPAADDGLAQIDGETALPLEQPLISGLTADLGHLALVLVRPGDSDAVRLAWSRGEPPPASEDVAALVQQVTNAETLDAPELRTDLLRWSWLPRSELAKTMPSADSIARLRDEGGAQGRALARRLTLIAADDPSAAPIPGDPDPLAARDLLLWRIATIRGADAASWRSEAAATTDPLVLRALLVDVSRDPEHLLLPVLVERVQLQADGKLALDADPLDQHHLFATVFDNLRLSPTPLRPWAVALLDRVTPLARGPIERFIARHGRERPVK
jgi:hypothetical protein